LLTYLSLLTAFFVSSSVAEELVDDAHGFRLRLPDGYVADPEVVAANPKVIHAFVTRDADDKGRRLFLIVEGLKYTIGPQHMKAEQMPPGFQGRISTMKWRGFDVDVVEVPEQLNGVDLVTFNVQIPLKKAAIQLKLFGAADRKTELEDLLRQSLDGLEGESNWNPVTSPIAARMSPESYGNALLIFAVTLIVGGLIALYAISRFTPKGTVLAIAAVIYVASWSLEGVKSREGLVLSGSMRMLGFAGGLLGIIDLLRKRRPRPGEAGQNPFQQNGPTS